MTGAGPTGPPARTVLLAGATGLVGRELLALLASDPTVGEIRALVRAPMPPELERPRVRPCVADFERLDGLGDLYAVDQVFCALGTTIRAAGSEAAFRHVDFDYPAAIARAARGRGARHLLLVSAIGADAGSRIFYNRVKGELEEDILGMGFRSVTIARPSLLLGSRKERRAGEEMGKLFGWVFPPRWRPVHSRQVAAGLALSARADEPGVHILENSELRKVSSAPQ